ncbi:FliM/FliN family flagellar motor C-terminal domain-containing protein [Microbulbifer sp. ANSA005]|uniref:FliM/FliN family flagellar motor C-terminal domain-containing protein n=1 Tax=Microbulbifer sp. ANSA005 TaxID=3243362 RepID=UPI0040437DCC
MRANYFYTYSPKQIQRVENFIIDKCKEWGLRWFKKEDIKPTVKNLSNLSLDTKAIKTRKYFGGCLHIEAWELQSSQIVGALLGRQVSLKDTEHNICIEILNKLFSDLACQFPNVTLDSEPSCLKESVFCYGSGWCVVEIQISEELYTKIYLGQEIVFSLLDIDHSSISDDISICSMDSILKDQSVKFIANVSNLKLSIEDLLEIEVGDIVLLDKKIESKITLKSENDEIDIVGEMCSKKTNSAVRLASN